MDDRSHLGWFEDARFGVFIHWGIYSAGQYAESWSFYNHGGEGQDPRETLPYETYMAQRHAFGARRYDPIEWASLFERAGAKYAVLTTKHHDGMALWDTAEHLSVVRDAAAGRDLVAPFCSALRSRQLRVGLYYSHLDWSHPSYPSVHKDDAGVTRSQKRWPGWKYSYPVGEQDDSVRWADFLRFHRLQLRELCERFSPDLLWFDGDWERSAAQWRFAELRDQLRAWRPGVVLNGRLGDLGDYATPEQGLPTVAPDGPWEFCMTMNRSWATATDPGYKSSIELIRTLAECAGMGGNLLLNISPLADGTILDAQRERLLEIGAWLNVNGSAVYGTRAGLPHGHFYGPSTLSRDGRTLYLFLFNNPTGEIALRGLCNVIQSVHFMDDASNPLPCRVSGGASWAGIPGTVYVQLPEPPSTHERVRVLCLRLDSPLKLYRGHGQTITHN
jgi:alpha-L-fucosidase